MRLGAPDGAHLALHPVRYQYRWRPWRVDEDGWDRNWLVVRGNVRTDAGATWSFTSPCLTTWEARELGGWLQAAATGSVASCAAPGPDGEGLRSFTEPSLAFSLAEDDPAQVSLRVHLSLEAAPPWADEETKLDLYAHFLLLRLDVHELLAAADGWRRDLKRFPVR